MDKPMPTIIHLKPNKLAEVFEELLALAKEGALQNVMLAGFNNENEIITCSCNLDIVEQQHLVSFMQIDTTVRTLRETYPEKK